MDNRRGRGFTIIELLVATVVVIMFIGVLVPSLARAGGGSMTAQSLANLQQLAMSHASYSFDWNDRQVTYAVDGLASYGSDAASAMSNYESVTGEDHPSIQAGYCDGGAPWAFWFSLGSNPDFVLPINFEGSLETLGSFRFTNFKTLHDYVDGRFYSPTYYAPADAAVMPLVEPLFDLPYEFHSVQNDFNSNNYWPSVYVWSPAARYHPGVFRAEAEGGFQAPFSYDESLDTLPMSAVLHPELKTMLIERHWVQSPPDACNPNVPPESATYNGCEPYYFNHGLDSTPATLFYDGSVRLLPSTEVLAADQQILKGTGGVDGLWHRGTPFGTNGYLIDAGFDGVPLSHHILTTDGLFGRDTLDGAGLGATTPTFDATRRRRPGLGDTALPDISFEPLFGGTP